VSAPRGENNPGVADAALFGERLLRIIDEGRRVSTYKLALLLALIDACASESGPNGEAPTELHTRVIAEHVVRLYLPQTNDFVSRDDATTTLRQITAKRSPVVAAVSDLNRHAAANGCRSVDQILMRFPDQWARTVDVVELTFARYPLQLLQVINGQHLPFLYDIPWDGNVSLRRLHEPGGGMVRFRSGAGDGLLRLAPLMRPLIETHWTRMVADINGIDLEQERLRSHLFGATRQSFPAQLRSGLADLHDRRCFYCHRPLPTQFEIDHFIPWARHPNDAIENLVPADRPCNNNKRDSLAAMKHLARWAERLGTHDDRLGHLATDCRWQTDRVQTLAVARSTYRHLPSGTPLWLDRNHVETYDGQLPGELQTW